MISQNKPLIKNYLTYLAVFLFLTYISLFVVNRLYFHPLPIFNTQIADQKIGDANDQISKNQFNQAIASASPFDSFPKTHQKAALYVYANSYQGLKNWQKALENYQEILIVSNNKTEISDLETKIALCYKEIADPAASIEHLKTAIRANPKNQDAWLNLISAYLFIDQKNLAKNTAKEALTLLPENAEIISLYTNINT